MLFSKLIWLKTKLNYVGEILHIHFKYFKSFPEMLLAFRLRKHCLFIVTTFKSWKNTKMWPAKILSITILQSVCKYLTIDRSCKFGVKKANKEVTGLKLSSKYSQWVKKGRHNIGGNVRDTDMTQKSLRIGHYRQKTNPFLVPSSLSGWIKSF